MIELYPHNIPTLAELNEKVEKYKKVALLQGTGTGKTFVIGKHIEEHDYKNVLVLVPSISIGEQWLDTIPSVTIMTYQAMINGIDSKYDLVIADEMHHLGSEVWGKKFTELFMQDADQKVIGATATEIRYLDNSRDMAEELFGGVAVRGTDLATAISTGVLPRPKYVTAYHGSEQDFDEYREKINTIADAKQRKGLSRRLEMCIQNRIPIKTAMYENLSMADHKIIVFLNGLCEVDKAIEMFAEIFPNCDCNFVSSKRPDKENRSSISQFRYSKKQISILFEVDMLNEGVHVKGADTVVMFRNTESPQIYFQQMGRCLDANSRTEKVIFDFVRNAKNIRSNIKGSAEKDIIREINKRIKDKERKIIIKTYTQDLEDVLCDIKRAISGSFTQDEIEFMQKNTDMTASEIGKELGRNRGCITAFCERNGIRIKKTEKVPITQEEIEYIRTHTDMTATQIADSLGRDSAVIVVFCKNNGIKLHNGKTDRMLSENEKEYIRKHYPELSLKQIASNIKRDVGTISRFVKSDGIVKKRRKIKQIDILTGKTIKTYGSPSEASLEIKGSKSSGVGNIYACLNNTTKTAYGFRWEYEN